MRTPLSSYEFTAAQDVQSFLRFLEEARGNPIAAHGPSIDFVLLDHIRLAQDLLGGRPSTPVIRATASVEQRVAKRRHPLRPFQNAISEFAVLKAPFHPNA